MLGAGAHIVAPDGRLLMIEQERFGVVEWGGIGGAIEHGESIEQCAVREAREESGLTVRLERLIRISEFWESDRMTGVGFLFLATPDPWPQEVDLPPFDGISRFRSYRWCTRDEVHELPRWPYDITHTAWPAEVEVPLVHRIEATPTLRIRRARRGEADALTALARRSKAHWDYDPEFIERAAAEMVVRPADIDAHEVWVLEDGTGQVVGFHRVILGAPAILEDLWLEPSAIGHGSGRLLWDHAVAIARAARAEAIELDADPNAVGFYARMGARVIGETPSAIVPGRSLPRMRLDL
jgi:ADP-ribose pyrophosphatase YjhB (NUDIX family)